MTRILSATRCSRPAATTTIRKTVAARPFVFDGKAVAATASMGVATTQGEKALAPAELLRAADGQLYAAKHAGRNRVVA